MKWLFACLCLAAAPTLLALDGRIRASNGETFEGEVSIDRKLGLVITNAQIGSTNIPLPMLAEALFNSSAQKQTNETATAALSLPAGWTNKDIGPILRAGKATYENGNFVLASAGTRIWGAEPDEFHFVYRRFVGDGQIVARVTGTDAAM